MRVCAGRQGGNVNQFEFPSTMTILIYPVLQYYSTYVRLCLMG